MNVLQYEDIKIGDEYSFSRVLTREDIGVFAKLSGDTNPLHSDATYSRETPFGEPIAHGMLGASLFSALIGLHCPGKYALYVSQSANFRKPIFPDREVVVRGKVLKKVDSLKIVTLETLVTDKASGEVLISGEAMARVLQ